MIPLCKYNDFHYILYIYTFSYINIILCVYEKNKSKKKNYFETWKEHAYGNFLYIVRKTCVFLI